MYWVRRCGCMSLQDLETRCPEAGRLQRAVDEALQRYNEACAALHQHLYGPDENRPMARIARAEGNSMEIVLTDVRQ